MKGKAIALLDRYGRVFLAVCLGLSILGLMANYLVPDENILTKSINMAEDNDQMIPLEPATEVTYALHSDYPMRGIQVGINTQGNTFLKGNVLYTVYKTGTQTQVASGSVALSSLVPDKTTNIQYVYMPFEDKNQCIGDLTVHFTYDGLDTGLAPALMANATQLDKTETRVNDVVFAGSLKSYYIYVYYRYPLQLDFKYFILLFGAAFLTVETRKRVGQNEEK